jgi:hypothetical protein
MLAGCLSDPPSDDELIERFTSNQSDFETLVQMMKEDIAHTSIERFHRDYVKYSDQEQTLDEPRIDQYRELFNKLGLNSIDYGYYFPSGEEFFSITVYAAGAFPDEGRYKGYKYFPNGYIERPDAILVNSLAYDPQNHGPGAYLFRKITEKWYLYFLY